MLRRSKDFLTFYSAVRVQLNFQKKIYRQLFHLAVTLWLFQEKLKPAGTTEKSPQRDEINEFGRIRCPRCQWQPSALSRWYCGDCDYPEYFYNGCGAAWNTFTTRGRCPGCGHQWSWTICLRCYRWSRHNDWYRKNE